MSFIIMKRAISEAFRDTMSEMVTRAKVLKKVEKRFAKNEKGETNTLLENLILMK